METLCADVKNLQQVQDESGDFLAVEIWKGLTFDSKGNITKIDFESDFGYNLFRGSDEEEVDETPTIGPEGSMDLQWIPQSVKYFNISDLDISGSVDTTKLPRSLKAFNISFNSFEGDFDMAGLPDKIEVLNIQHNALSGYLVLADFPRSLRRLYASHNAFAGEIKMEDLPPGMLTFNVRENKLCGDISLRNLPVGIENINLKLNLFAQDVLEVNVVNAAMYRRIFVDKAKFGKIVDTDGNDVTDAFL